MAFKVKHIIGCDLCYNQIADNQIEVFATSQENANAIAHGRGWQFARYMRADGKLIRYVHACPGHDVVLKDEYEKLVPRGDF